MIAERTAVQAWRLGCRSAAVAVVYWLCAAEARGQLVISQIFGAAGQNVSAANGDFVEIFNRSCVSIPLSQYTVQVASSISSSTWSMVALPNVALAPGRYFCIRLSNAATGMPFTADVNGTAIGDVLLSSGGKAAIVFGNSVLNATCPPQSSVIDLVIYAATTGTCTESTRFFPSSPIGEGRGYQRKLGGCQDTNVNLDDFVSATAPAIPRTSQTPVNTCTPQNVFGACNLTTGSCRAVENAAACDALAGTYLGDCIQCVFPEACCLPTSPTATCTLVTPAQCAQQGGINSAGQLSCPPTPACPGVGRCCSANGSCALTFAAQCIAPDFFGGVGTTCAGTPCQGRCCNIDGSCTLVGPNLCVAPSTFAGPGTTCAGTPCQGRCCGIDGSCNVVGPSLCPAPSAFGGIGTNCTDPNGCIGACCSFIGGQCSMQGPGNCLAPNAFAGVGVTCADVQCSGRCCNSNGACSVTSVGQCSGVFTIGQTCDPIDVRTFSGVNLLIPIGLPAPGGYGPTASNIQTLTGVVGSITDVDVGAVVQHTWSGDVKIEIAHLGTVVTLVDLIGHGQPDSGGCATGNLNILIDDEGPGGPIEAQCNATAPAASSPPNFTPQNSPGMPYTPGGLSAFDGLDPNGEWTISVSDGFNLDSGTLLSWSLHISHVGQVCPVSGCTSIITGEPCFGDVNADGVVNGVDIGRFSACVVLGGTGCACADMDHSGAVNTADMAQFVAGVMSGSCGP